MKRAFGIRSGRQEKRKRLRLNLSLTLKGREGRPLRIALYVVAGIALVLLLARALRPEVQLMSTAEVKEITERGVLIVGVRDDTPGFALDGEGLEVELAELFAKYLLPETPGEASLKLVTVSSQTASTKLSDGSIDAAIALMQKGASSKFAYSYSYYTDRCAIAVKPENRQRPLEEMLIGYVQNTAGSNMLSRYVNAHETKVERSLIDRLKGRTPELPPDAVTYTRKAFASYPDMLNALQNGTIDGAVLTGVYAERYSESYSFVFHEISLGEVDYAIAVSADEPAIAQLADVFLYEMRQSGQLAALLKKYGLD